MFGGKKGLYPLRKPAKALTARMVQTVTEPGKYFDGHGLFLRVDKTGGRFWVQRIVINGKRTELGLGSPDFVTLAEARAVAFDNRKLGRNWRREDADISALATRGRPQGQLCAVHRGPRGIGGSDQRGVRRIAVDDICILSLCENRRANAHHRKNNG
ncbi:DUF4102 domain-containing protein [Paracoccus caeni]|uniref:DUF4102 domain-containing protein n=1 Tax=Paracoccus caeni TaxID=657651 RepID=A0A934SEW3_9RHOB|nr:DUF4102 domain-containing protein [Paracoccus caeni]